MDSLPRIADLPSVFREKAAQLERYAPVAAEAFREAAELLEKTLSESLMEALDLHTAAQESGYSESHLRRMLREGALPDAGGGMILRRDLPRKPSRGLASPHLQPISSRLQVAHAVATQGR